MLQRWAVWGAVAILSLDVMGCTIITTTGNDPSPSPRTRQRPHRRAIGRPAPPPPPRKAPGPNQPAARPVARTSPELPPQPAKTEPPRTPTRATVMPSGIAAGRPAGFTPDAAPAYWIWQGPRGGWRIRTTTKDALHLFRGRFTALRSTVSGVSPSRTELRDQVWKSGDDWLFSFKTAGHADGLTFQTRDNGCVKFDLQLDGGPAPKRIVIGKNQVSPATNHFILCPHGKTATPEPAPNPPPLRRSPVP